MEVRLCLRASLDGRRRRRALHLFKESKMAVEKRPPDHSNDAGERTANAAELAARLAPPEEQAEATVAHPGSNNGGSIIVDTGSLKLPKGMIEAEKETTRALRPHPVVIVILC